MGSIVVRDLIKTYHWKGRTTHALRGVTFSVKKGEFIKWEKRFLPANGIGILILSTTKGVMDHQKAKKERLGGTLLGFVY